MLYIGAYMRFILLFVFSIATFSAYAIQELDSMAVIVNDDVITHRELDLRVNEFMHQIKSSNTNIPDINAFKKQALEKIIRDKIQLQHASRLGIKVDDVALNRALNQIAAQNRVSLEEMRARIESDGIDFSRFREQARNDLIIQELQRRVVANKVNVTDQEIRQFVQNNLNNNLGNIKYRLLHILIATPEAAKPEDIKKSREKTEQLYEEIRNGTGSDFSFSSIAVKESDGRNAINGGKLGWRAANELPEQFVEAIKDLEIGETSKPIRSASGFHLIKLLEQANTGEQTVTQTHARHILIRTGTKITDEQAKSLLNDVKRKLSKGHKFSELAEEHSQDPGSKNNGGDLGWANPGSFVPAFENAMNNLEIGETSEPFQSQFGWHILQVVNRREQKKTASNYEDQARKIIRRRKIEEEMDLWLRRIRDEAYVEYIDPKLSLRSE